MQSVSWTCQCSILWIQMYRVYSTSSSTCNLPRMLTLILPTTTHIKVFVYLTKEDHPTTGHLQVALPATFPNNEPTQSNITRSLRTSNVGVVDEITTCGIVQQQVSRNDIDCGRSIGIETSNQNTTHQSHPCDDNTQIPNPTLQIDGRPSMALTMLRR